jgi:hypothetical protein
VLPLFRNTSNKTILSLVAVLLISPLLIDLLKVISDGKWNMSNPFFSIATHYDKKIGITEDNVSHLADSKRHL